MTWRSGVACGAGSFFRGRATRARTECSSARQRSKPATGVSHRTRRAFRRRSLLRVRFEKASRVMRVSAKCGGRCPRQASTCGLDGTATSRDSTTDGCARLAQRERDPRRNRAARFLGRGPCSWTRIRDPTRIGVPHKRIAVIRPRVRLTPLRIEIPSRQANRRGRGGREPVDVASHYWFRPFVGLNASEIRTSCDSCSRAVESSSLRSPWGPPPWLPPPAFRVSRRVSPRALGPSRASHRFGATRWPKRKRASRNDRCSTSFLDRRRASHRRRSGSRKPTSRPNRAR